MQKKILNSAVALALGLPLAAMAAPGVIFDQDGAGGGGFTQIGEMSWANGNALFDNVLEAAQTAGFIYAQTVLSGLLTPDLMTTVPLLGAYTFTYQFKLPVTTAQVSTTQVSFENRVDDNYFKIFADLNPNSLNFNAGTGFGNILQTGQVLIMSGSVQIRDGSSPFSVSDTSPAGLSRFLGALNGTDTATALLGGSTDLDVMVNYVNTAFLPTALIGTLMDVDFTVDTLGFSAPFSSSVAVSDTVVGITPFFGDAQATVVTFGSPSQTTTVVVARNDFLCASNDPNVANTSPCDFQMQTSGNSHFTRDIPEPGSLALLGAGLLVGGLAKRRKRRTVS